MSDNLSRRQVIDLIVGLPLAAVAVAAVAAPADAKIAPASVQYVDKAPAGKKPCSACKFYIAGKTASAKGACQQVSGAIAPGGYCVIWAPKG